MQGQSLCSSLPWLSDRQDLSVFQPYLNDELGVAFADGERVNADVAEVDVDVLAHLVAGDGLAQLVNVVGELSRSRTWKSQKILLEARVVLISVKTFYG